VYEGEWRESEISGRGVATYANGDVYEGMFLSGKRQGEGTMRYAGGKEASGTWEDGVLTDNLNRTE
ncbi:MAG: 2-isopropylmalate synthase, partial [Roseovarius sp.]